MAFEIGLLHDIDSLSPPIASPMGHLVDKDDAWLIGRYYISKNDTVAVCLLEDKRADIFVIEEDYSELAEGGFPPEVLLEGEKVGEVTAAPESKVILPFRNAEGYEAQLYVNYLSIGSRVIHLADGTITYIKDPWAKKKKN